MNMEHKPNPQYDEQRPHVESAAVSEKDSLSGKSPIRLVFLVALTVFFVEAMDIFILDFLPKIPEFMEAFFDALLMITLVSPVLYFGLFRYLTRQLEERRKLSRELEKHRIHLEQLVAERTADLSKINETLKHEIKERKSAEVNLREALIESCKRRDEVSALLEGARTILKNREFKAAAKNICHYCMDLIGATAGCAALIDSIGTENEDLFLDSGYRSPAVDLWAPMPIRELRAEVCAKAAAVYDNHINQGKGHILQPDGDLVPENVLFAPMILEGKVAGVIGLANKRADFNKNDLRIATAFGELAAVALLNSRTLESLQNSEERFRSVVSTATESIIVIDSKGEIQFWNNGAEKMFGYSDAEVAGANIDLIIPQRYQMAHHRALRAFTSGNESRLTDKALGMTGIRKDGTEFPLELTLANWRANNELFFTSIIRDVTERKQAEEALNRLNLELEERVKMRTSELHKEIEERKLAESRIRESKIMLQAVFDGISDPLILVDNHMRIKMLNKMAASYYRISDDIMFTDKPCHEAFGNLELCNDCRIPAAASKGQYLSFERGSFVNPGAVEQVVVYPIEERDAGNGNAIIRITDITEAKELERQLIQNEKMASLGILVSTIAHEINNPNNFISFNIPILRDYVTEITPLLDEYADKNSHFELCNMPYVEFRQDIFKLLENIENGSRRISTFVSNLREYSRGGHIRPFSWLDLAVLIDKVLNLIQVEIKKTIKIFNKSICTELPEIYSDPHAIEQILINLLMNASQAVSGENSRVDLNVMPSGDKRGVVIKVSDNGCGMDANTVLKIFEPFFTTKPVPKGTGLGLYVCHNLITDLGGRIKVESEPGKGSTFIVTLPGKDPQDTKNNSFQGK